MDLKQYFEPQNINLCICFMWAKSVNFLPKNKEIHKIAKHLVNSYFILNIFNRKQTLISY